MLTYSNHSSYDCRSATESLMCLGSGSWSTAAMKDGPLGSEALTTGLHSREREKEGFYVAVIFHMNLIVHGVCLMSGQPIKIDQ